MGYQDFIKVGKYCRFSLFLYSFKKERYYLSEKTIVLFAQKVLSFLAKVYWFCILLITNELRRVLF